MKKLLEGILGFRRHVFPAYRLTFARLASGQSPDCLFVTCSDSRVVPSLFASTQPGELFVVRNVGNLVPPDTPETPADEESSVTAALEYAVFELGVSDVVICGHSGCGAMKALLDAGGAPQSPAHLGAWLKNAEPALRRLREGERPPAEGELDQQDRLSLLNVLEQVRHLQTYPFVRERVQAGRLRLHAWWFDIGTADVFAFEPDVDGFVAIDEEEAERILAHERRR